jgi:tetratricopeptide (TPR) repeat protein
VSPSGASGRDSGSGGEDGGRTGSIYERYKDALRRGHVAALRGRNEEAIEAYREAAGIAPDRAVPHASIGSVLLKQGRRDEAVAAFDRALELAPGDEASIRGLAEARGDAPAGAEPVAPAPASELAVGPDREAQPESGAEPESAESAEPEAEPTEPEREPAEPVGLGIALGAAAEAHLQAGELDQAHAGLLAAARSHRRAGRLAAALDACDLALGVAPADPELHLLLAELYLDRGWRQLATDKLLLLARLAELDADAATVDRLRGLVAARLSDEPRLATLVA